MIEIGGALNKSGLTSRKLLIENLKGRNQSVVIADEMENRKN